MKAGIASGSYSIYWKFMQPSRTFAMRKPARSGQSTFVRIRMASNYEFKLRRTIASLETEAIGS
jgi:hypothetical protein